MSAFGKRWVVVALALAAIAGLLARRVALSGHFRRAPTHHVSGASPESEKPRAATTAAGEVGARMPEFRVKDLSGREISSEDLRGKIVLIDFWATWCAPCKVEMPGYQKLQEKYGGRGLVVLGLALDSDPATISQFAERLGVNYMLGLSTTEVQQAFGGILGIPTTILVDRQGIIRKKVVGFEYPQAFESALKKLL